MDDYENNQDVQGEGNTGVQEDMVQLPSLMEKLITILEQTGLPYAYSQFAEGEAPDPPFICYLLPGSSNFGADGRVYKKIGRVHLEVYTDEKDPELEESIEDVLDQHGIFYQKSEVWIASEKLYEVLYSFEEVA